MRPILLLITYATLSAGQGAIAEEGAIDESTSVNTELQNSAPPSDPNPETTLNPNPPPPSDPNPEPPSIPNPASASVPDHAPPGGTSNIPEAVQNVLSDLGQVVKRIISLDMDLTSALNRRISPILEAIAKVKKEPESSLIKGLAKMERAAANNILANNLQ